jgi:hypothetical protein
MRKNPKSEVLVQFGIFIRKVLLVYILSDMPVDMLGLGQVHTTLTSDSVSGFFSNEANFTRSVVNIYDQFNMQSC